MLCRLPAPLLASGVSLGPDGPAVQPSHVPVLLDVCKPEMVSGSRSRRTSHMTNIAILTGRIAREPDTLKIKPVLSDAAGGVEGGGTGSGEEADNRDALEIA